MATFDFARGTVAYAAGGAKLGTLALSGSPTHATRVAFRGGMALGDFQGLYVESGGAIVLHRAEFRTDGMGVSFENKNQAESFVIGLRDADPAKHYVVFAADDLGAAPTEWTCVACVGNAAAGGNLSIPVATAGHPARFFRVYAADAPVAVGSTYDDNEFEAGD